MATPRHWLGGEHNFFAAGSWTPAGRPRPGDTLTIGPGTASAPNIAHVHDRALDRVTVLLDDGPGPTGSPFVPTLSLSDAVITSGTVIENAVESGVMGVSDTEAILVNGRVRNLGTIAENPEALIGNTLDITIGAHGRLINGSTGIISGTNISNINIAGGRGSTLVNDGTISGQGTTIDIAVPVSGRGVFSTSRGVGFGSSFGTRTTLEFHQTVGAGETIAVNDATLIVDAPLRFLATIDDLSVTPADPDANNSSVLLKGEHATSLTFQNDILTVQNGQQTLATLHFSPGLVADDFGLVDTSAGSRIDIVAPAPGAASAQALSSSILVPPSLPNHS